MNRRRFLGLSGTVAASVIVGQVPSPRHADAQASIGSQSNAPILVVVDLQGGNDALNTLVPATGIYHDARPTLGIADNDLLTFAGLAYGVHPGLGSLQRLWDADQLTALYGTGLDGQGRSHFVAQDAWRTARPGEPARSGWLGRWLEASNRNDIRPLRAIALGQSTLAAQGESGRPVAIQSVEGFNLTPPRGHDEVTQAVLAMGQPQIDGLFGEAQAAIPATISAVDQLQGLISQVSVDEDADPDDDASLFAAAQAIIQGDVGTEVIYITINGFDTHSLQAPRQDHLLRLVADGIDGLYQQLEQSGHADRTLTLVVSEFGRRVAENGSAGTDHGRGGLSFLIGPPMASSQVVGEPSLDDLVDGDLRITIDTRSMYHTALTWLGAVESQIESVLGTEWNDLQLLG